VQPGAFLVDQLPVLSGANEVTLVLTDIDGRQRSVTLPLYVTTRLLAKGVSDFSIEAGAVRRQYGARSGDYGRAFASATWREGLSDTVTLEAHGEAADGLWLAGGSGAVALHAVMALTASAAVSHGPAADGALWALGAERNGRRLNLAVRYEQLEGAFQDVADLEGEGHSRRRAVATIGLNLGRPGVLNLAYVAEQRADHTSSAVFTAGYGADVFRRRARLSLTGYGTLREERQWGVALSLSIPLGAGGLLSAGVQKRRDLRTYEANIRGAAMDNRLTWEARAVEGDATAREAQLRWSGGRVDARAQVLNDGDTSAVRIEAAQSLVAFGGDLFVADRVDDAFAVVRVGDIPGVEVFRENQSVGRTSPAGRLFVNHLRAYEGNSLSIDPRGLPLDAALDTTAKTVAPRRGGGVMLDFEVSEERSALVMLRTPQGPPPPAGAQVTVAGRTFPMGYDGEVYLRGLAAGANRLDVAWRGASCQVSVMAAAALGRIPRLGPFTCAP
jgi:outer membrane usher protein